MRCISTPLISLLWAVPAMSFELFRYRFSDRSNPASPIMPLPASKLQRKCGPILGCPRLSLESEVSTQDEMLREKGQEILERKIRYFESAIRDAHSQGLFVAPDAKAKAKNCSPVASGTGASPRSPRPGTDPGIKKPANWVQPIFMGRAQTVWPTLLDSRRIFFTNLAERAEAPIGRTCLCTFRWKKLFVPDKRLRCSITTFCIAAFQSVREDVVSRTPGRKGFSCYQQFTPRHMQSSRHGFGSTMIGIGREPQSSCISKIVASKPPRQPSQRLPSGKH
jgi:hypothetical protein